MFIPSRLLASCTAVLAVSLPANADVLNVRGPASDYNQIRAAVNAAHDGDIIRIWSGNYNPFHIEDVGLSLIVVEGEQATVDGTARVHNLALGKEVHIVGLNCTGTDTSGLILFGNEGRVRIQDCVLRGSLHDSSQCCGVIPTAPIQVIDCADAVLVDCDCVGAGGDDVWDWWTTWGAYGADGLSISNSTVSVYGSNLVGGWGSSHYDGHGSYGGNGGNGITAVQSTLYLSGTNARGGHGGSGGGGGIFDPPGDGGGGGHGIAASGASDVHLLDANLTGMAGGAAGGSGAISGPNGQALFLFGGSTSDTLVGEARSMQSPRFAVEGQSVDLTFHGQVGDAVFLVGSDAAFYRYHPFWHGPLMIGAPFDFERVPMGSIDGSGQLISPISIPTLPSFYAQAWQLQAVYLTPALDVYLGAPQTVVLLDSAQL